MKLNIPKLSRRMSILTVAAAAVLVLVAGTVSANALHIFPAFSQPKTQKQSAVVTPLPSKSPTPSPTPSPAADAPKTVDGHTYGVTTPNEARATQPSNKSLVLSIKDVTIGVGGKSQTITASSPDGLPISQVANAGGSGVTAMINGSPTAYATQQTFYILTTVGPGTYTLHINADTTTKVRYDGYVTVHVTNASYSLSASPQINTMGSGGLSSFKVAITIVRANGYAGAPTVALASAPSGTPCISSSMTMANADTWYWDCNVDGSTVHGSFPLTFSASDGVLSATPVATTVMY